MERIRTNRNEEIQDISKVLRIHFKNEYYFFFKFKDSKLLEKPALWHKKSGMEKNRVIEIHGLQQ